MRARHLRLIRLSAMLAAVLGAACATSSVAVRGTWELRASDGQRLPNDGTIAGPLWFIFRPGRTAQLAEMTWSAGLGTCQDEVGAFRNGTMDFSRSRYPMIVTFHSRSRATMRFPELPNQTWQLRRVSREIGVGCE